MGRAGFAARIPSGRGGLSASPRAARPSADLAEDGVVAASGGARVDDADAVSTTAMHLPLHEDREPASDSPVGSSSEHGCSSLEGAHLAG